jgi:hypothetical protein
MTDFVPLWISASKQQPARSKQRRVCHTQWRDSSTARTKFFRMIIPTLYDGYTCLQITWRGWRYERHFLYHIKFIWLISQTLIKRYYVGKGSSASSGDIEEDATTMQAQILYRGWWDKKQRCNRRGLEHARFMQPSCKKIIIGRLTSKR